MSEALPRTLRMAPPERAIMQAPVSGRTVTECLRDFSTDEWRMWVRSGGTVPSEFRRNVYRMLRKGRT